MDTIIFNKKKKHHIQTSDIKYIAHNKYPTIYAQITKWVYRYSIHFTTITNLLYWNSTIPKCIAQCHGTNSTTFDAIFSGRSIGRSAVGKNFKLLFLSRNPLFWSVEVDHHFIHFCYHFFLSFLTLPSSC